MYIPDTQENQYMVNTAFVAQSFADIHCKFQKVEGLAEMNNTQLLEVTNNVFENRDQAVAGQMDETESIPVGSCVGKSRSSTTDCFPNAEERLPLRRQPVCLLQSGWTLE